MVIYTLCDSGFPGIVRYVGKTVNAEARLKRHSRDLVGHQHRKNWIRSVISAGRTIEQTVIAFAATNGEANRLECYYIQLFRQLGFDLTNTTVGGDGVVGYKYSKTQKRAMGARSRMAWENGVHTAESIERTAAAHRGTKRSAKTCARISQAKRGRSLPVFTDEHKAKIAAANRKSKPYVVKLNKIPWTIERRVKQGVSQKKRWARNRKLNLVEKVG